MPAYNERCVPKGLPPTGFVGFLDVHAGRADHAEQLLDAAGAWLAARGAARAIGPCQYFSGQDMGLLIEGFDQPPALFQTHGRPGDLLLWEKAGYRESAGLATYRIPAEVIDARGPGLVAAGDAAARRLGLTARSMRRGGADLELIRTLFNASFASSPENLPYDHDLFHHIVAPLRPLLDPRLVRFVERDGRPVGFTLSVPDLNELLARMGGRAGPLDLLRARSRARRIRTAVVLIAGVLPEMPMGVAPVLFGETFRGVSEGGYREIRTTWVHDDNTAMRYLIERGLPVAPDRRYLLLERALGES
ncbi:hypothetical protein [Streptomyces bohaiensis]|uniref:GNAT family N-acetyltransferase n=1 Tax=Streptomyces bohaiensis TaxID=1431344 RepID=A0ABX1C651_9ACTN|nr:hypothetical protein [Streptomyces bohaiensis]NJQ14438.1 hypothetical protein [Streptomyces bohaiensis]